METVREPNKCYGCDSLYGARQVLLDALTKADGDSGRSERRLRPEAMED